jgi:hypothetical protein
MANLICDTNVFYNLGLGKMKPGDFAGGSDTLFYSPVSILEISGKMTDLEFEQRRAAAKAILDHGAKQLVDPESHLTTLFGLKLAEASFDWSHAVKGVAAAADLNALTAGVADYVDRVLRRVSVDEVGKWRCVTEQQWKDDMLRLMETEIPKFAPWYKLPKDQREKQRKPHLTGDTKKQFIKGTTTHDWLVTLINACFERSLFKADLPDEPPAGFASAYVKAAEGVTCYCTVYTQYLIKLLTEEMMPQLNDSGDLELFLYSTNDDWVLVTAEKRWADIAARAGYSQRLRKV